MGSDLHLRPVFDSADRDLAAGLFESVRKLSAGRVGVTRPSYSEIESAAMEVIGAAARQARLVTRFDAAANSSAVSAEMLATSGACTPA